MVLFDGHCNLCNATVDLLVRLDRRRRLRYASLQGDLGGRVRSHLQGPAPDSLLFWDGESVLTEMDAVVAVARVLGFPFSLLRVLVLLPRTLRDGLYRLVARNRYRWFGRRETCRVPTAEERSLFLD